MYDWKLKRWKAECRDVEKLMRQWEQGNEKDDMMFLIADAWLAQAESGGRNAQAVYRMEQAAEQKDARAACAMGQMFHSGWAVGKDLKKAKAWYEKAAALGSEEAVAELKRLKKQKTIHVIAVIVFLLFFMVLAGVGLFLYETKGPKAETEIPLVNEEPEEEQIENPEDKQEKEPEAEDEPAEDGRVIVGEDTEYKKVADYEEFMTELSELAEEYDTGLMISGEQKTNRLILKFEGEELDLSGFLADKVVSRSGNEVIIQFSTEEEAKRCQDALRNMANILYIDRDSYEKVSADSGRVLSDGLAHYSWGVEDMQFDQLTAWIAGNGYNRKITVAVVDTGVQVHEEEADRILSGYDVVDGSDGHVDTNGHGTHVAGTIFDCTRGTEVYILPIRVFGDEDYTLSSYIDAGIEYAIGQSVDVINMSLGGDSGDCGKRDYLMEQADNSGIICVAASGNDAVDCAGHCPAHVASCITVGAYDIHHQIASFSNYGDSVDVCGPGVEIVSYGIGGDEFAVMNGTSMATPHVTALAALMKMVMPEASPAQIEKYMKDYCIVGNDEKYWGAGIPQASYFME